MTIGEAWITIFTTCLQTVASDSNYKDKTYGEIVDAAYNLAKSAMRKSHAEMKSLSAYSNYTTLAPTGAQDTQVAANLPLEGDYALAATEKKAPRIPRQGVPEESSALISGPS
jgi:hypothetical protein